jgi:glycerol-3-phosphate dehydrogenase (NAD(P)+)
VLILGYGEMGHAVEYLLAGRRALQIWQRRPPAGNPAPPLATAVAASEFVIFCVPGNAHPELAPRVAATLAATSLCLTVAKGLDPDGRTPAERLIDAVGRERLAVLYGPMIAEEIRAGRPAFAQCGSATDAIHARVAGLFAGTHLRLEPARDLHGLSWSVILKNVYAMAFGMADELAVGDNVRGFLAVAALHELSGLVRHLGGEPQTAYQLAGLGDLITTATSAGSHHHELGRRMIRGEPHLGGEGMRTLQALRDRPRFETRHYPLFQLVDDCSRDVATTRARFLRYLDSAVS